MPLPHDLTLWPLQSSHDDGENRLSPLEGVIMRNTSEESLRTEDCEGPVSDGPAKDKEEPDRGVGSENEGEILCSDRAELIERIKRGESPTWVPNQALREEYIKNNHGEFPRLSPKSPSPKALSPLLPAAELKSIIQKKSSPCKGVVCDPSDIQRPRSALHAGDFTENAVKVNLEAALQHSPRPPRLPSYAFHAGPLSTSPTTPWYTPSHSFQESKAVEQFSPSERCSDTSDRRPWRSRAPSLKSYSSSSYVLKAPTTPLVQQLNNTDLDFSPRDRSISPDKVNRRHTLPPHGFQSMHSSPGDPSPVLNPSARPPISYRREGTFPYGHHPRRSLNSSYSLQASTSPQTPAFLRSRRTSFSSDASPLQRAHMVGSYEESILRGWMSTAPSRPLDFTAKIGVIGRGTCKPSCPPHVTVPFPAVFYSYGTGNGRNIPNDDPSPYVGHIDLQHSLQPVEPEDALASGFDADVEIQSNENSIDVDSVSTKMISRKSRKRRRASPSSAPPRGSYRIPQQGQLQIIIKNPNKTAVKLFLVPYNLEGMEPGTKTFVRQRSYSADPVVDSPLALKMASDPVLTCRKPTLRYLIHLNMCSPSKGRFYLYHQIRVVFANRVPDNKEQLQNDIQLPQPRYSAYRPNRDSLTGPSSDTGAKLIAEKAYRRRSSGFAFVTDGLNGRSTQTFASDSTFSFNGGPVVPPIPAIPFDIASRQRPAQEYASGENEAMELDASRPTTAPDMQSPLSDKTNRFRGVQLSSSHLSSSSEGSESYSKLSKGDLGYGGMFGRPGTPEPGDGLLARRLKSLPLGFKRDAGTSMDGEM